MVQMTQVLHGDLAVNGSVPKSVHPCKMYTKVVQNIHHDEKGLHTVGQDPRFFMQVLNMIPWVSIAYLFECFICNSLDLQNKAIIYSMPCYSAQAII